MAATSLLGFGTSDGGAADCCKPVRGTDAPYGLLLEAEPGAVLGAPLEATAAPPLVLGAAAPGAALCAAASPAWPCSVLEAEALSPGAAWAEAVAAGAVRVEAVTTGGEAMISSARTVCSSPVSFDRTVK